MTSIPTLSRSRRRFLGAIGGLTFAAFAPRTARAARIDSDPARVAAAIEPIATDLMTRHALPGLAVGVMLGGRPHVSNFGVAALATGRLVDDDTLFEIGSISKTLTATLAAYAEATGRLSLADSPGRHLLVLRGTPIDRATLLHRGTYTAGGLPLQFPDEVVDDAGALEWLARWRPLASPGTRRLYSNPSLGLFGWAAAAALGRDFGAAMQDWVWPAFGLRRTYLVVPEQAREHYAWGYREDRPVQVSPGPFDLPTYGVKTTAGDLLRFLAAQIDPGKLTDEAMRRAVASTQRGRFRAGPLVQGLGWEQFGYPTSREWLLGGNASEMVFAPQPVQPVAPGWEASPRLFDKTGSTNGFGAYVLFVPSAQVGVVLLANRNYPLPARVEAAWTILQRLAG